MKIGLLTYDACHLKTEQLLGCFAHEEKISISMYALPFVERKKRTIRFPHRPEMATGAHTNDLAKYYGIPYARISDVNEIKDDMDYCVIGGAGILAGAFVDRVKVVNCHPGLQPAVRGLDAYKWAIYDRMPLGISLHIIDREVDAGTHLKSVRTPVYQHDIYETVARRHYESEIVLLSQFFRYVDSPAPYLDGLTVRPARMRMPAKIEEEMIDGFHEYVQTYALSKDV